jgi:hypothetical protein
LCCSLPAACDSTCSFLQLPCKVTELLLCCCQLLLQHLRCFVT